MEVLVTAETWLFIDIPSLIMLFRVAPSQPGRDLAAPLIGIGPVGLFDIILVDIAITIVTLVKRVGESDCRCMPRCRPIDRATVLVVQLVCTKKIFLGRDLVSAMFQKIHRPFTSGFDRYRFRKTVRTCY